MMRAVVRSSGVDHVIAQLSDSVVVCLWRARPTPAAFTACESAIRDLLDAGKKVGLLIVIDEGSKPPDSEFRDQSAQVLRDIDQQLSASAVVITMPGLLGVAIRSIFTGISLVSRRNHPTRNFADVPDACAWIAPYLKNTEPIDVAQLSEEVARIRKTP